MGAPLSKFKSVFGSGADPKEAAKKADRAEIRRWVKRGLLSVTEKKEGREITYSKVALTKDGKAQIA